MSTTYVDLEYTKFPDAIDTIDRFINPAASDMPAINEYYSYIKQNNLTAANAVVESNPRLKRMNLDTERMNQILDPLIALERFYFSDVQTYLINLVKPKGYWSDSTQYVKMDVVNYINGGAIESYMCILKPPIGTLPTNTTYFISITLRGEKGNAGLGLTPYGEWNNVTDYPQNAMVTHQNTIYYAKKPNSQSRPTSENGVSTNDNWVCVMVLSQAADTILMPYGKSIANVIDGIELDDFSRLVGDRFYYTFETIGEDVNIEYLKYKSNDVIYATKTTTRSETGDEIAYSEITICEESNFEKTRVTKFNKITSTWESR